MAGPHPAIGIDALPEGVLQLVFSKLSLPERLRISTVRKRWHAITLSPPLLAQLTIRAAGNSWLDKLRHATSWLVRRAAGSMQQLRIDLDGVTDADTEEASEAASLIAGALAAAGSSGVLRAVKIDMGYGLQLHLGGWAVALSGLQRLSADGGEGHISVSGDLRGLTALQQLELDNSYLEFAAGTRLPASLTSLSLGVTSSNGRLPRQVAELTRLHTLRLVGRCYKSNRCGALAALSGTLQSFHFDSCNLPNCLPGMLALCTLIVIDGSADHDQQWDVQNNHILRATLQQLPHLEEVVVRVPSPMALVPGPWQHSVKQLEAPADVLAASLPALDEALRLQELSVLEAGKNEQQAAALQVLRWAGEQHAAPLQLLELCIPYNEDPTLALLNACLAFKSRHPHVNLEVKYPAGLMQLHQLVGSLTG